MTDPAMRRIQPVINGNTQTASVSRPRFNARRRHISEPCGNNRSDKATVAMRIRIVVSMLAIHEHGQLTPSTSQDADRWRRDSDARPRLPQCATCSHQRTLCAFQQNTTASLLTIASGARS